MERVCKVKIYSFLLVLCLLPYYRLVNILHSSQDNLTLSWKIVEDTRKLFLSKGYKLKCNLEDTLVDSYKIIQRNIKEVGEKLGLIGTTYEMKENISKKTFENAAEMFTYLNYCLPKRFISFYENLFNTASAENLTLAILSVMKTSKNAEQRSSSRIFQKYLTLLKLGYYENIQFLSKTGVDASGKCQTKMKNDSFNVACGKNLQFLGVYKTF